VAPVQFFVSVAARVSNCYASSPALADAVPRTDLMLPAWLRRCFGLDRSVEMPAHMSVSTAERPVEIRIPQAMFSSVLRHVEDPSRGEEAGFIVCRHAKADSGPILIATDWVPIPEAHIVSRNEGYVVAWSAQFNAEVIDLADKAGSALVLVHSHGPTAGPRLSGEYKENAALLFPGVSRILAGRPSGSVVLGDRAASGQFWVDGKPVAKLAVLKVIGVPIKRWKPNDVTRKVPLPSRRRLDRQSRAIAADSDRRLLEAVVAVVGNSGGGSHCCQQLAHLGVGTIIPLDGQRVADTNLGRMIGSVPSDVDTSLKTDVMERMIHAIDPSMRVINVPREFPHPATIEAIEDGRRRGWVCGQLPGSRPTEHVLPPLPRSLRRCRHKHPDPRRRAGIRRRSSDCRDP
jgi:ThiF family